ncbi:MAG: hypothetical protein JRE14_17405 [Deltaproteobacteria bacterium]|nr:hypothetical protein [Deltaproteobacteria bacterium]MBW2635843.1 hypothetical protein [Deltaproteobacteria bacterium]
MFFKTLDLDKDGFLSRSDLNNSAKRFRWSWHEAPLLAVLDLLSISKPIPKSEFIALIHQIHNDPLGPYGNILLKSPHFLQPASLRGDRIPNNKTAGEDNRNEIQKKERPAQPDFNTLAGFLEKATCTKVAIQYQSLLENLKVVVDLSLSGARTKNYISSPAFNDLSAVESAVVQMLDEGVQVVRQVMWN